MCLGLQVGVRASRCVTAGFVGHEGGLDVSLPSMWAMRGDQRRLATIFKH